MSVSTRNSYGGTYYFEESGNQNGHTQAFILLVRPICVDIFVARFQEKEKQDFPNEARAARECWTCYVLEMEGRGGVEEGGEQGEDAVGDRSQSYHTFTDGNVLLLLCNSPA